MTDKTDDCIRKEYESNNIYGVDRICNRLKRDAHEYADRLLEEKIWTVRRHAQTGVLVDLCCATGEHLFSLANVADRCVGIDFSRPFIERASDEAQARGFKNVHFIVGDAKKLPFEDDSVATLYSFSALYAIPGVAEVFKEIGRVLAPEGRCILDLGNCRSLNAICVRAYTELPPSFHLTLEEMRKFCEANDLRIIEHRKFQLLPLWAGKPRWLWPLLHPCWKRLMSKRIKGKMLDEWVSTCPGLRRFAFRHLIVCQKTSGNGVG